MPGWYNVVVSVSFVAILIVFGVGTFCDLEGSALAAIGVVREDGWDQRAKVDAVSIPNSYAGLVELPDKCSSYIDDHFGFRYSLVRCNKKIYRDLFADSDAQKMLLGKDGWRFLKSTNSVVEYAEHRYPLTDDELNQLVGDFGAINDSLQEHGIPFFVVVAPNKHSIYPEMLPDFVNSAQFTRFDQIKNASAQGLFPFDLRQELRSQKSTGRLYERQGTHWTDRGMWLGFVKMMEAVKRHLPDRGTSMPNVHFADLEEGPFEFGDATELVPVAQYDQKFAAVKAAEPGETESLGVATDGMTDFQKRHLPFRIHGLGQGRVVIFRDSFLTRMVPLLATQFETIDLYWQTHVDLEIVREAKPDLVILEFAERHLMHPDRFTTEN